MPDSPRDPAAEAEKMLREMSSQFPHDAATLVHRPSLIALLRELVERREGERKLAELCLETMAVVDEAYAATGFLKVAKTSEQRMRIEAACASLPAPPAEEKTSVPHGAPNGGQDMGPNEY